MIFPHIPYHATPKVCKCGIPISSLQRPKILCLSQFSVFLNLKNEAKNILCRYGIVFSEGLYRMGNVG